MRGRTGLMVLAVALAGCPRGGQISEPPQPEPTAPAPTPPDEPTTTTAVDPTHPLEIVPARARALVMGRSAQRLAEIWERDRIKGEFPVWYAEMVHDMERDLKRDLLDPAQLAQLGIDPTAPLGLAVLSLSDEALMVFGGSPEPQRLIDTLEQLAGKPLARQGVGRSQLVLLDEDLTLVIRDGFFAFVLVDRHRPGAPDYPREVASIDPGRSLAHAEVLSKAYAGLPADADVQGMLDLAGIIRDELARDRRRGQERIGEAAQQLAEAQRRGAPPEELELLQRDLQQTRGQVAMRQRKQQIGEMLFERTLGSIEGIGAAASADRRGLLGRMHVALTPDAVFRDLLVPSSAPPATLRAMDETPLAIVSAKVDVDTAIELLAQATMASGSSYAELNEELRRELKVDFDRELRPLLDGTGAWALTARDIADPPLDKDLLTAMLGGALSFGVNDEAKARAVLKRWVDVLLGVAASEASEIDGYTFSLPGDAPTVWVSVVNNQLVVATDPGWIARVRDGKAGTAGDTLPDPQAWAQLTEGGAVAHLAMHHRLPIMMFAALFGSFGNVGSFGSAGFPGDVDFTLESEFPEAPIHSIPSSTASQGLQKKYAGLWEKRRKVARKRRSAQLWETWKQADALGLTAGVVRETETGLLVEGGHYVEGGAGAYLETVLRLTHRDDTKTSFDAELARIDAKLKTIRDKLLQARRTDIKRHQARAGRSKP